MQFILRSNVEMFTAVMFVIIFTTVEVLAFHSDDKLNPDTFLEYFGITAVVYNNNSIYLNVSWDNNISNESILDISIENNDVESECFYPYDDMYDLYNQNAILPSMNITNPVEEILLGCSYNINITLEEVNIGYLYYVPECIENYCICIRDETNLIKLRSVENVEEYTYRITYTSHNNSLVKGNFYITEIFYSKENTGNYFEVPKVKYGKGQFEVVMEYLNHEDNYTLYVNYQDFDNINPKCEYTSQLSFTAYVPPVNTNYVGLKILLVLLLFLSSILILYGFLRWSKYYQKTIEGLKKCICPTNDNEQIIRNFSTSFPCTHQEVNALYTPLELVEPKNSDLYEITRERIIIKDVIGEGAFGKVYYAKAYRLNGSTGYTMVAVKLLRGGAPKEELADFQDEIKMLKKIGVHKNIVKLLACVTKTEPYMMVMELVSTGDLKEYLLKLREIWLKNKNKRCFFPEDMDDKLIKIIEPEVKKCISGNDSPTKIPILSPNSPALDAIPSLSEGITSFDVDSQTPLLSDIGGRPDPVLDHKELQVFALQIATGMAYLEQIPVTHRDLAARNILITKDKVLKISDFGMSRTGPYVNRHLKKVPLRWMAIESIEDFKTDSKSDVWSFGVVLWEIGTLGAFPYENIPNELITKELKSGRRLPRPEICTDELYALMRRCWMENPKDRLSFKELVEHLQIKREHIYVDFSKVNPKYVFPPTDSNT